MDPYMRFSASLSQCKESRLLERKSLIISAIIESTTHNLGEVSLKRISKEMKAWISINLLLWGFGSD